MGPSKRKGSVRRQVLDLAKDDSPSRLTWQTKYEHALPRDVTQQNGDSQTVISSKINNNPLSEFLGNYNSDSDSEETTKPSNNNLDAKVEDFLKEIQSISIKPSSDSIQISSETLNFQSCNTQKYKSITYPSHVTSWQQCYDQTSGYPYYWNTETNEVTWEMPSDLKTAIANIASKQQLQQHQSDFQQSEPEPEIEVRKKSCKYPWQTKSYSENEKIEMITSFGPQSGEGSEEEKKQEEPNNKKIEKTKLDVASVGSIDYYSQPTKIKSTCISLAPEDPEGMNDNSYETSSLLAHGVQDNGPPGDDSFQDTKLIQWDSYSTINKAKIFIHTQAKEETRNKISNSSKFNNDNLEIDNVVQINNEQNNKNISKKNSNKSFSNQNSNIADDVIAQIEKETPPDYKNGSEKENQIEPKIFNNENSEINTLQTTSTLSAITLVANYSDDSESEDSNCNEKHKSSEKLKIFSSKPLFPIEIPQEKEEKVKSVFPCVEEDVSRLIIDNFPKEISQDDFKSANNIYKSEIETTSPGALKAFKRKKRIEFATTTYGPSTSKLNVKTCNLESGVVSATTQYNMDPNSNEHRGFGFNSNKYNMDGERKTYKNFGGIQFVKAETLNLKTNTESKERSEIENDGENSIIKNSIEPIQNEEIQDSATLLKEKVDFLTGGNREISPIQHMAIELETLVLAWEQGALTPSYLLRWLNEKCAELIHHEKKAAPSGWTCLWDRQSKRYYYRNTATRAIQWEYPNVDEKIRTKEDDVEAGGDEMDICDTPPHLSPTEPVKRTDEQPSPPPPPVISDTTEYVTPLSPTPQPPSPPKISFCSENEISTIKSAKKKKRKIDDITKKEEKNVSVTTTLENSEEVEEAPPLPPLPPPPPPPPEESPPPLPESPPPLPLDTDQPLPPGVDEPEYSLYRRVSPKHCYKKAQSDSSAYSTELMMTYGYGLPVVPSNSQAMTLPLQTLEYHTYMHDPVTNPYLVQSTSTSHVIQCSAKKPKVSLNSELMSFYSDLAMLEAPSSEHNSNSQSKPSHPTTPEQEVPPPAVVTNVNTVAITTSVVSSSSTGKSSETVTSNGVNIKKKKKAKTTSGLSLKKKGVSSLVAKWQQVQQEVKKDFSDDEDLSPTKNK